MTGPDDVGRILRETALWIVRSGVAAVDPVRLVAQALEADPFGAPEDGRLVVAAVGKAGGGMLRGAAGSLGRGWDAALAVVPRGLEKTVPTGVEAYAAGHPLPDAVGQRASRRLQALADGLGDRDRLLVLLSGGGSALLTLPGEPLTLEDVQAATGLLLGSGAPITELNTVRKHLEILKGGGLARAAAPARVRAFAISDVVGDPLDVIASGPVSPDPTTFDQAIGILRERDLWERVPPSVRLRLEKGAGGAYAETPGVGDPLFEGVAISVIGNAERAARAAVEAAEGLGYRVELGSVTLTGEAREVGRGLGRMALDLPPGVCRLFAGETTVTVTGDGRGGRNQEVALAAAEALEGRNDTLVFSVGTDGVDGPTDAAGAWVTGTTAARARALGLNARTALANNDAYPFFEALGDLVMTGPTGTNVMDLLGIVSGPPPIRPPGSLPNEPARSPA